MLPRPFSLALSISLPRSLFLQAAVLVHGFSALATGPGLFICLHSDPGLALLHSGGGGSGCGEGSGGGSLGSIGCVVAVTLALGGGVEPAVLPTLRHRPASAEELFAATTTPGLHAGSSPVLEVRYELAQGHRGRPSGGSEDEDEGGGDGSRSGRRSAGGERGAVLLLPRAELGSHSALAPRLLPDAHCLVASGRLGTDPRCALLPPRCPPRRAPKHWKRTA